MQITTIVYLGKRVPGFWTKIVPPNSCANYNRISNSIVHLGGTAFLSLNFSCSCYLPMQILLKQEKRYLAMIMWTWFWWRIWPNFSRNASWAGMSHIWWWLKWLGVKIMTLAVWRYDNIDKGDYWGWKGKFWHFLWLFFFFNLWLCPFSTSGCALFGCSLSSATFTAPVTREIWTSAYSFIFHNIFCIISFLWQHIRINRFTFKQSKVFSQLTQAQSAVVADGSLETTASLEMLDFLCALHD